MKANGVTLAVLVLAACSDPGGNQNLTVVYWETIAERGGDSALLYDADQDPHVVWVERTGDPEIVDFEYSIASGPLHYATRHAGVWTTETLPWSGAVPSLTLDASGSPIIAFYDGSQETVVERGADDLWHATVLDDSAGGFEGHAHGEIAQRVLVDRQGRLHLLYWAGISDTLYYGLRDASRQWSVDAVGQGFDAHHAAMSLNDDDEAVIAWQADQYRLVLSRRWEGGASWTVTELDLPFVGHGWDGIEERGRFPSIVAGDGAEAWVIEWVTLLGQDEVGNVTHVLAVVGGKVGLEYETQILESGLQDPEHGLTPAPTALAPRPTGGVVQRWERGHGIWLNNGTRVPPEIHHAAHSWSWALEPISGYDGAVFVGDDGSLRYMTSVPGGGPVEHPIIQGRDAGVPPADGAVVDDPDVPGWNAVGGRGFTAGTAEYPSLAILDGRPLVAFRDGATGNQLTVQHWGGPAAGWTTLGAAGLSRSQVIWPSAAVYEDTPFVAYVEVEDPPSGVVVQSLGWAGWAPVGASPAAPSIGGGEQVALALYGGRPYVAYASELEGLLATVRTYDGLAWTPVGPDAVSEDWIDQRLALCYRTGTLFLAYADRAHEGKLTVQKWDPTAEMWTALGGPGVSAGAASAISLDAVGDVPYVALSDASELGVSVLRFTGGAWEHVGPAGFSTPESLYTSIAATESRVYVALNGLASQGWVQVWDGTAWGPLGYGLLSAASADGLSLQVDGQRVFVAFTDEAQGRKATVMKYVPE